MVKLTRGERNNNPGNIERTKTKWKGMAEDQSGDSRFIVFDKPEWGIRALAKVLLTYSHLWDIDTVREIINRWAPPHENDTGAYVNAVASAVGVESDEKIDVTDPHILQYLTTAIIKHENGRVLYSEDEISSGVHRALA